MSYYQQIHDLAKDSSLYVGKLVNDTQLIFNPGTPTFPEAYMPYADTFVSFEGSADEYESFQPAAYANSYNASKFMNIVHTCQTNDAISATLSRFNAQNTEFLYLTNLALNPNPYSDLPDNNTWGQELAYIANSTA